MRAQRPGSPRRHPLASALIVTVGVCLTVPMRAANGPKAFPTPEAAVAALSDAVRASDLSGLLALLGPGGDELASSSDAATGRQNRDVFIVAMAEGWHLGDTGPGRKELVVGNESWPFPIPLVKTANGWIFDTAAGKEEVLSRRIGRNELAAIRTSRIYVAAQRVYARQGHDGQPAGTYARRFASQPGTEDGLYWPVVKGSPHSPLGALVAEAAAEGRTLGDETHPPQPFHGYYFRILESQSASAPGGARSYVVDGRMSGGFAMVAWPAEYDATGIVTFIVNQDGVVYEKDLGPDTAAIAAGLKTFDPDVTWEKVQ